MLRELYGVAEMFLICPQWECFRKFESWKSKCCNSNVAVMAFFYVEPSIAISLDPLCAIVWLDASAYFKGVWSILINDTSEQDRIFDGAE